MLSTVIVTHVTNTFKIKRLKVSRCVQYSTLVLSIRKPERDFIRGEMRAEMDKNEINNSRKSVKILLPAHRFNFSKSMGQNFLIDAGIPKKFVRLSGIDKSCGILEVGPGLGALTQELSKAAGFVTAVELDKRLIPILNTEFANHKNVSIVQGDILKLDIKKLVIEAMQGLSYHACANLPYNITTPAITAFIDSGIFKSVTVMVQREVALRICAKPGSREYGAFTVYANYHTTPEMLFDVSSECFTPRPKVTSSVVRMITRTENLLNLEDERIFFQVVRAAFGQRRKTLVNALFAVFGKAYSKETISKTVSDCGFDVRVRGEVLSMDEFLNLSSFFRQ